MSPFDYALGLVSILVGLALADVAASLHRLLRQARLVRWDGRVVLCVVLVIITITGMWFEVWSIHSVKAVLSFPFYLSLFLEFMVLFLVCAACLPDEPEKSCDLGAILREKQNLPMVAVRVVSDVLFSSLDLFCRAPPEQPLANASFRGLGWLTAISFCVARDDSFSLVSLHSASRANRLPSFELLELYVGPLTLVHPPCPSNKTMQPTAGRRNI